jgi:hypothetical protein
VSLICLDNKWILCVNWMCLTWDLRFSSAVVTNVGIFWDVVPCSPYMSRRFRGIYYVHLQVPKSAEQEMSRHSHYFLARLIPEPEDGWYVPSKRRRTFVFNATNVFGLSPWSLLHLLKASLLFTEFKKMAVILKILIHAVVLKGTARGFKPRCVSCRQTAFSC